MFTASGKRMHSLGEVNLEVESGDLTTVLKFIVASSLITDGILGTDFNLILVTGWKLVLLLV